MFIADCGAPWRPTARRVTRSEHPVTTRRGGPSHSEALRTGDTRHRSEETLRVGPRRHYAPHRAGTSSSVQALRAPMSHSKFPAGTLSSHPPIRYSELVLSCRSEPAPSAQHRTVAPSQRPARSGHCKPAPSTERLLRASAQHGAAAASSRGHSEPVVGAE